MFCVDRLNCLFYVACAVSQKEKRKLDDCNFRRDFLKKKSVSNLFCALFARSALVNISCGGIMKKFIETPKSALVVDRGEKDSIAKNE